MVAGYDLAIVTTGMNPVPAKSLSILIAACLALPVHAGVYKCVENGTGKVTYSDVPCHGKDSGGYVEVEPSSGRAAGEATSVYRGVRPYAYGSQLDYGVGSVRMRGGIAVDPRACEEAARVYELEAGSAKRDPFALATKRSIMLTACGIPDSPPPASSVMIPVPNSPTKAAITKCDPTGCSDSLGQRYISGGGDNYFAPNGKACRLVSGRMECP